MSLSEMARLAKSSDLAKNDAQWWPKWMEAYARSVHQVDASRGRDLRYQETASIGRFVLSETGRQMNRTTRLLE